MLCIYITVLVGSEEKLIAFIPARVLVVLIVTEVEIV